MGRRSTWTQQELEYVERVAGKVPAPVIARAINKPLSTLKTKANVMGLGLHVPKRILEKHWPEYLRKNGGSHAANLVHS
ncbi:hypothetical protein [Pantoea piersonii]|uniref:hypothetical protein n=1 Tax=Pantoea piersonii TaxID=2364647 RepID=UPI002898972F|nr:hypothetical protein [Pantoea piersonii]